MASKTATKATKGKATKADAAQKAQKAPKVAKAAKAPKPANVEKQIADLLTKYIYAAIVDTKDSWEGECKYSDDKYQTYDNLIADKDSRKKLVPVFTISSEAKQMFANLFNSFTAELNNVELDDADNLETIVDKLADANADCYAKGMMSIASVNKSRLGDKLISVNDPTAYFRSRITSDAGKHVSKAVAMARISQLFDDFLKAIARNAAWDIWVRGVSFNKNYLIGHLITQGMEPELVSALLMFRPTKPKKASATSATKGSTKKASGASSAKKEDDDDDEEEELDEDEEEDEKPAPKKKPSGAKSSNKSAKKVQEEEEEELDEDEEELDEDEDD